MIVAQLHALYPALPRNSHILFLNDPTPADWYSMFFISRLSYRDDTLLVDCAKRIGRPDDAKLAAYDHVFDYAVGRFIELHKPWIRPAMPTVEMDPWGGKFFHIDWAPVTPDRPAAPGERVIAKAIDLGPTDPPTRPGQPFPNDPLLSVVNPVAVSVDGVRAAVDLKIGWPGEANAYRVDFYVPAGAGCGQLPVQLESMNAAGPTTRLPVCSSALTSPAPAARSTGSSPPVHRPV